MVPSLPQQGGPVPSEPPSLLQLARLAGVFAGDTARSARTRAVCSPPAWHAP